MTETLLAKDAPDMPVADAPSASRTDWADRAVLPALVTLLLGTAALYLWDLSASGWANSFYSASVQAGSVSWKAFFFGSSDAANSITVDKTPLALWPMMLSVRVFGLNSWAILVPQAIEGVLSVWLLYLTVRRTTANAWAGLAAGLMLAVTPVATLMFRFNNPDAMLVLLLIGSVYATVRALDTPTHAARWIALGGALVGLAFLAKMLQAFLVLPALAVVYLLCASVPLMKRFTHLLLAFVSMLIAGGWWIAIVSLWPADSRPYIGGSQTNSILELTLGYNGFGRLTGDETGSVSANGGAGGQWGSTGLSRLFNSEIGGQIAWLLPIALVLLVAGLYWAWRSEGRTSNAVRGLVVWGGWLVTTWLTFSFMAGIFHAYYTVALAPAIAAVVAIGGYVLWQHRDSDAATLIAAFAVALGATTSFVLLNRSSDFVPWLKWVVIVGGTIVAVTLALWRFTPRPAALAAAAAGAVLLLAGPTAYSVATASTAHTGSIVTAGPSTGSGGAGAGAAGQGGPGQGGLAQGGAPQGTNTGTMTGPPNGAQQTTTNGGASAGGLLNGAESSSDIDALLTADASDYTWVAAAVGSNSAAGYQLSTQLPVMAIGGFNGSDPSPTLKEFKEYVANGDIHYFIASGSGGGGGPTASGSTSSEIAEWVAANFTATTVDGITLYDMTAAN